MGYAFPGGLPAQWRSFILPTSCPGCGRDTGAYATGPFCAPCWERLDPWGPACALCGIRLPQEGLCGPCLIKPPSQEGMGHALAYEGHARDAVHYWKFGGTWYLSDPLADLLVPHLDRLPEAFQAAPLTYIPPHPWRLLQKDYHPPRLLADALARRTGRGVAPLLVKRGFRKPQSSLSRQRRLKNVRGTLRLRKGVPIPEAAVLLDDVATTGATIREALAVLGSAGIRHLAALTVARTP